MSFLITSVCLVIHKAESMRLLDGSHMTERKPLRSTPCLTCLMETVRSLNMITTLWVHELAPNVVIAMLRLSWACAIQPRPLARSVWWSTTLVLQSALAASFSEDSLARLHEPLSELQAATVKPPSRQRPIVSLSICRSLHQLHHCERLQEVHWKFPHPVSAKPYQCEWVHCAYYPQRVLVQSTPSLSSITISG